MPGAAELGAEFPIEYRIGYRKLPNGSDVTPPDGQLVPSPFSQRHFWKPELGRTIGGNTIRGTLVGIDWIYGATSDRVVQILRDCYDPNIPQVWIQFYDAYIDNPRWYSAMMQEPHVERGAGGTISVCFISFRKLEPYIS